MNSEEMVPIEIDLSVVNNGGVMEAVDYRRFSSSVRRVLDSIFGGAFAPVKVKGSKQEIESFAKVVARDKQYIRMVAKYGLDDPRVYKDKFKLRKAIAKFERTTGIKYPFEPVRYNTGSL